MNYPKVSVIVAVYNVEQYLKRSLDCLKNQTLSDLEFILIDDCSTDNSLSILNEYATKDNRFKIIASENNEGAAEARNKGLKIAKGEYLGFIDPDDAIDLNYYEELYKKAKEGNYDIVKCVRKNIKGKKTYQTELNKNILKSKFNFSYEWTTAIYRTSIIRQNSINFPAEIRKGQDTVFLYKIILNSNSIALIDNVNYYYYMRDNSLNSSKIPLKSVLSGIKAYEMILENFNNSNIYEEDFNTYMDFYENRLTALTSGFLYRSDDKQCKTIVAQALIDLFWKCKDPQKLREIFSNPSILKYIDTKDVNGLISYFKKFKRYKDFHETNTFFKKIFSIRKVNNTHLNIRILGLSLSIKVKVA